MEEKGLLNPSDSLMPTSKAIREQKSLGFIKLRFRDKYSPRLRIPMGKLSSEQLVKVAEIAQKYGLGEVRLTIRKGLEVPMVDIKDLEQARAEVEEAGFLLAGCGRTVRPVKTCQGSLCPYGLVDVDAIGLELQEAHFRPYPGLPHKFKIAVAGCPNACIKPQLDDLGFMGIVEPALVPDECIKCGLCIEVCSEKAWSVGPEGVPVWDAGKCYYCGDCLRVCPKDAIRVRRSGLAVFVGGKFGKHPAWGAKVAELVPPWAVAELTAGTIQFYVEEGRDEERLAQTVTRVGLKRFKEKVVYPLLGRDCEPRSKTGSLSGFVGISEEMGGYAGYCS